MNMKEYQANFLEDLERLDFPTGIYTDNGSGQPHRLNFSLDGDNIISYGADGQHVEEEFTISWWMNNPHFIMMWF